MGKKDVFISHASTDRAQADAVCRHLEACGLACWVAPRDIEPGRSWGECIVRALDECRVLVLLLTARANESRHVVREVERADGKRAAVVTLRLDAVPLNPTLEYFLSADHWLDAASGPLDPHLPALAQAVRARLGAPARPQVASQAAAAPAISQAEWARGFDELAPDDWDRAPQGRIAQFFHRLLADR